MKTLTSRFVLTSLACTYSFPISSRRAAVKRFRNRIYLVEEPFSFSAYGSDPPESQFGPGWKAVT